jgi:hypothetical protein
MFSRAEAKIGNFILLIFTASILSACGNSEDANKIKAIIDINSLNVTGLEVSSPNIVIETGASEQFTAHAIINEGQDDPIDVSSKVNWSTSDSSIASINQSGLLTSNIMDGLVSISATWADLRASKELTLSSAELLSISVDAPSISVCDTYQLTATGSYEDATDRIITSLVSWESDNESLLSVNSTGLVTSLGHGAADITATRGTVSGSSSITIEDDLESISISAGNDEVAVNGSLAFTATGTYSATSDSRSEVTQNITELASWQSDDATKLSISNATGTKGVATGVAEGTANISASCNSTVAVNSIPSEITVTPEVLINDVSINEDATILEFKVIDSPEQLVARLKRSDGTFSTDITDDDDTIWRIERVISGTSLELSNIKGSKGEITFTAPGITEISVRYNDSDGNLGPFEDTIEIEVVE